MTRCKIAVTGANGRLGFELLKQGCIPIYSDVLIPQSLEVELRIIRPDVVIHCAAITDVDGAEGVVEDRSWAVNVDGTENLRDLFVGRIIYISTDFVFDGKKGPYKEDVLPNPLNVYGDTKLEGERVLRVADTVVRTTILYGGYKSDFVTRILAKLDVGHSFTVTQSLRGTPTYVPSLATALIQLVDIDFPGIVNIAGDMQLSRFEFACMVANVFGYPTDKILPTKKVSGAAKRPRKAGLKVGLAKRMELLITSPMYGLEQMREERT